MRILFIGIDYYEYTRRIVEEMRAQGHQVMFHSMELTSRRHKLLKRYAPDRFDRALIAYHRRILEGERTRAYDLVLFLQVHRMDPAVVADFRTAFPAARFVLYNWDSLKTHDYRRYLRFFDRVVTFDRDDADALNADYLPLFALPEYFAADHAGTPELDIYFVGTVVTPDRFRAARALKKYCATEGLQLKMHLYCSVAGLFSLLRRGLWMPELTLRSISQAEIVSFMRRSRATFDVPNHRQSGYTMRFVENLCAGLKIITTNRRVQTEEFYDPARFLVLDDALEFRDVPRFLSSAVPRPADFSRFSLASWVGELITSAASRRLTPEIGVAAGPAVR